MRIGVGVELSHGRVTTLQLEDKLIFTRVVQSIASEQGEDAIEPYGFWNEKEKPLSPKKRVVVCNNLPQLPFKNTALTSKLYKEINRRLDLHPEMLEDIRNLGRSISSTFEDVSFEMFGTYAFGIEWTEEIFLKSYGFHSKQLDDDKLLDKLIRFLQLCADIDLSETLVFVNLKSFLEQEELESLFEQVFFLKQSVLLLESWPDANMYEYEVKTTVDKDLLVQL